MRGIFASFRAQVAQLLLKHFWQAHLLLSVPSLQEISYIARMACHAALKSSSEEPRPESKTCTTFVLCLSWCLSEGESLESSRIHEVSSEAMSILLAGATDQRGSEVRSFQIAFSCSCLPHEAMLMLGGPQLLQALLEFSPIAGCLNVLEMPSGPIGCIGHPPAPAQTFQPRLVSLSELPFARKRLPAQVTGLIGCCCTACFFWKPALSPRGANSCKKFEAVHPCDTQDGAALPAFLAAGGLFVLLGPRTPMRTQTASASWLNPTLPNAERSFLR